MAGEYDGDLWVYPLRYGETLANHEWVELHIHKLLTARFVSSAIAEGRRGDIGTALILWAESYRQDPAGTLPDDDMELAQLAKFGTDIEGWRAVRAGALYGFRPTLIDDAQPRKVARLGHPLIAEIAARTYARKSSRDQGRVSARLAVAKSRVRAQMEKMGYRKLAAQAELVERVADWLDKGSLFITRDNIMAALAEFGVPRLVAGGGVRES